jgi:hypothetical protein
VQALDEIGLRTRRLDLMACIFAAATQAVLEMGGAIAKRGFNATDGEVALLTSGQSLGLLSTFVVAHLALTHRKVPLVVWPEVARAVALGLIWFVSPAWALGFVVFHAFAQMFQNMTLPAKVTIYRRNYPSAIRGRVVGQNRQVQLVLATALSLVIAGALEWGAGNAHVVAILGASSMSAQTMVSVAIPTIAALGLFGTWAFSRVTVREEPAEESRGASSVGATLREFFKVWREDRRFRRYENFYIVFGFANIMTIPLTQIHAVDVLGANYLDLAMINVAIVQGAMALSMGFWGKIVDRYPPAALRGILNLVFAIDLLLLAVAPTIGWVYLGRVFRGVALGGGSLVWMLGSLHYAPSPEKVPIYMGIHTVLTGLRWALAPFVGVWMKQAFANDARPIFLFSFLVVFVVGIGMIRQRDDIPPTTTEPSPMPSPRTPGA